MYFTHKCYGILLLYILTITRYLRGQAHDSTGKIIIHTPVEFTESTQNPLSSDSVSRNDKLTHYTPTTKTNVRQTNQSRNRVEMPARRQIHETKPREIGESYENVYFRTLSPDFGDLNRSRLSGRKRMVVFNDKNDKYHAKQHEEKHSDGVPFKSYRNIDCNQGKIQNLHCGKFSITGNDENHSQMAYHSNSVTPGVRAGKIRVRGEIAKAESWMRMEPDVECGDESMTLTVRGRRALHLLVDRANASAVPLAQLPSQCGYSVESTWRDLTFVVPYNACHVNQEVDGSYVLPLIWRGTPVKMSCPMSQALAPSSLCCSSQGMTVRLQVQGAKEELRVKVRGKWMPLLSLALQCGYSMDRQHGTLLISAPFTACGITSKDGKYTLSLQIGEKAVTLACPSLPVQATQPLRPAADFPHYVTMGPTSSVSSTLLSNPSSITLSYPVRHPSFPFNPLPTLPPNQPPSPGIHVTSPLTTGSSVHPPLAQRLQAYPFSQYDYLHTMPLSESYQSPLSSSPPSQLPTTGPTKSKPGHTPVPSHPNYNNPHVTQYSSTTAGHPVHSEALTLLPPEYTRHPYYHNYHHPNIPMFEPPQGPSNGAKTGTSTNGPQVEPPAPHNLNPIFRVFPHYYLYHPKVPPYNPPQHPWPVTPASHSSTLPVSSSQTHRQTPVPHVPHPPPYPHYYTPQTPSGEVKRSHHPDNPFINLQSLKPITSPISSPTLIEIPFYQYTLNFPYKPPPIQKHRLGLQTNNPSRPMDEHPPVVPSPPASSPDQSGKSHPHGHLKWLPQQQPSNSHTAQSLSTSSTSVAHAATKPLLFPNFPPLYYPHLKSPISNPQQEQNPVTVLPTAPPASSSTSTPASGHPVYPHYYDHPYYYYTMPYDPYRLPQPVDHAFSAPSKGAPTPSQTSAHHTMETFHQPALPYDYSQAKMPIQITTQPRPSPATNSPQTSTPTPESTTPEIPPFPFDPYYHPGMSIYDQDQSYDPSTHAEKTSGAQASLDSDHYRRGSFARTPVASPTHAPHPTTNPTHNPSHHHIIHPQPSTIPSPHRPNPGPPGDLSDPVMKDPGFKTDTHTPCGLSDQDCDGSLGCCSYLVNECTSGRQFVFAVPGSLVDPTVSHPPLPVDSHVSCTPQRMTSGLYSVPLDGCGVHRYEDGQAMVHLLEFNALLSTQHKHSTTSEDSPVRLMVECRSIPGSPGRVRYQVMNTTPSPPVPTQGSLAVQLRIATDEHYSSFYSEKHRPLSLLQGQPLHLEVGLLSPPDMDPGLVLLVHYCLAYPDTPRARWLLIYDGCPSRGDSQAPPPPPAQPRHTRRLTITTFQSLPTGSPSHLEIYFMCSTEVCSPSDGDCIEGCFSLELI
ncbi:uncharacterized protein LOC112258738 isoform X1 [Oncorhynchus tshawytscha]|uniref:uncharacterized protein LOC112258738 isoform X1 n=1 Tax=Oncorhynchus tshawytscha TaxID=74940 RepID=UPI000D09B14A|nr:uncharacterized protein LOC112258738 isoform X1 [Oncorhynchus tshawytscha]XP_042183505.1 uncharacterized protein LOC112258738 isoform X1 [Oncorhynchus tshawytscha]